MLVFSPATIFGLLSLLIQGPGGAQAPETQEPERNVDLTRSFSCVMPEGWRQLTPDEAFQLQKAKSRIPADLLTGRPAEHFPYGAIDQWLAGAFDGRCLTMTRRPGEIPTDEQGVEALREHAARVTRDSGWEQEIVTADVTEVGPGKHKSIVCQTRWVQGSNRPPIQSLVLFVPTGGDTLILAFRTWESDFDAALPFFEQTAATFRFARPPRGSAKLTDRLLYPAIVGALVGALLLLLRRKAAARV